MRTSNCETCMNYEYDEEYEYYVCTKNLDEDEMYHFVVIRQIKHCLFRHIKIGLL